MGSIELTELAYPYMICTDFPFDGIKGSKKTRKSSIFRTPWTHRWVMSPYAKRNAHVFTCFSPWQQVSKPLIILGKFLNNSRLDQGWSEIYLTLCPRSRRCLESSLWFPAFTELLFLGSYLFLAAFDRNSNSDFPKSALITILTV